MCVWRASSNKTSRPSTLTPLLPIPVPPPSPACYHAVARGLIALSAVLCFAKKGVGELRDVRIPGQGGAGGGLIRSSQTELTERAGETESARRLIFVSAPCA